MVGMILLAVHVAAGAHCGTERWPVKVGADDQATKVDLTPKPISVDELAGLDPACPTGDEARGVSDEEFSTYTVNAVISCAKKEADKDIHLCLCDPDHYAHGKCESGHSLIAKSPDPGCLAGSQLKGDILYGRVELLKLIPDHVFTTGRSLIGKHVTVTGIGFRDRDHGQTGRAPSCLELHPIFDIK